MPIDSEHSYKYSWYCNLFCETSKHRTQMLKPRKRMGTWYRRYSSPFFPPLFFFFGSAAMCVYKTYMKMEVHNHHKKEQMHISIHIGFKKKRKCLSMCTKLSRHTHTFNKNPPKKVFSCHQLLMKVVHTQSPLHRIPKKKWGRKTRLHVQI